MGLVFLVGPYEVKSFVVPTPYQFSAQPSTRTALKVSSLRTWFSSVKDSRGTKAKNTHKLRNQPNQNRSEHDEDDHSTRVSVEGNQTTTTTWATLLHDDHIAGSAFPGNGTGINGDQMQVEKKRQELQYGIFSPTNIQKTTSAAYSSLKAPAFPDPSELASTLSSSIQNQTSKAWKNKPSTSMHPQQSNSAAPALGILSTLNPNATLTVADLQSILQKDGYVRQQDLTSSSVQPKKSKIHWDYLDDEFQKNNGSGVIQPQKVGEGRKTKSGVAFPQPSVLNAKTLRRGTTVAGGMVGMVLATTLLPNLWLVGMLSGALYGSDLITRTQEEPPSDFVGRNLLKLGVRLTNLALQVIDHVQTFWFLYKTGQLSYQYYKQYEAIDQRFQIQSKMDAWNARFQEGKRNFDAWEQENEIGRTMLAGLRTVWLVDERAKRRAKQSSRYRVVQYFYDTKYLVSRWLQKSWKRVRSREWVASFQEYWKGIQKDVLINSDGWGTRMGAIVASLVVVNMTGALFAISPGLLALVAILLGVIWPSWVPELADRLSLLLEETRARGRGDSEIGSDARSNLLIQPGTRINTARLLGRYDKTKYHSYRRSDGSKKFYRTGQSVFGPGGRWRQERMARQNRAQANRLLDPFSSGSGGGKGAQNSLWPFNNSKKQRTPGKEQWGIWKKN